MHTPRRRRTNTQKHHFGHTRPGNIYYRIDIIIICNPYRICITVVWHGNQRVTTDDTTYSRTQP